jgi:hypothetical protein
VVGWFGGVPQHKIPSSVMAKPCFKTRYFEEPWSPDRNVQYNLTLTDTDKVQVLHSRGDNGVCTQLAPHKIGVPKQTSPPKATPE